MVICHIYRQLPDEAKRIREQVFIKEQGFENEFDQTDEQAVHIVVFSGEQAAGTGRVYWDDALDSWVIGRVAVLPEYRKLRIGVEILSCLEDWLKQKGAKTVMISAQCQARGFYEKCGYTAFGESYLDEGCPHIRMKKEL